ncbi:MAG: 16S rRNA (cytosine(967)-C(5))-methyltransferase RsmB [Gammaproteobacteria bacterium]|nr:16S rRNA (cytosine(967)-C(5))-methyltransferase RsmB [Gammaproteobacteria bacterium]
MNARTAAAAVLAQIVSQGSSLSTALPPVLAKLRAPAERALAQELCFGAVRWYPRLTVVLDSLLDKPLKARDADVRCLMLLGLYQIIHMRIPDHAAVTETVAAAKTLGKPWASGLVNAILRGFLRDRDRLLFEADRDEAAATAHPAWLLEEIKAAWPDDWRAIIAANNQRPPMTLRVNARQKEQRVRRDDYLAKLAQTGMTASPAPHTTHGVILDQPVDVERLPGFGAGEVSVQDAAAQLAAMLLDVRPGQRVLDACAAPGGKTAHLLELQPDIDLIALDSDAVRLRRVEENLRRQRLHARVIQGDAALPDAWWDGAPFDRILLDAPCSATGVIRRHPDIKMLRRPEDINALAQTQARILEALWPLLRPGGMLLYATCSILPQENEQQMTRFLATHADAVERVIDATWGRPVSAGRQILPGEDDMDGFFYSCVQKQ